MRLIDELIRWKIMKSKQRMEVDTDSKVELLGSSETKCREGAKYMVGDLQNRHPHTHTKAVR